MSKQAKKKRSEISEKEPYQFSDEGTKKKIKKHLRDIKDVITEKDIANVKVPGTEKDATTSSEKEKEATEETMDALKKKQITPWDTLEE